MVIKLSNRNKAIPGDSLVPRQATAALSQKAAEAEPEVHIMASPIVPKSWGTGEGMMRRIIVWLAIVLLTVALGGGCAGILSESVGENGKVDRIQLGTGSKWSSWDHTNTKQDDMCIMLKNVSTF